MFWHLTSDIHNDKVKRDIMMTGKMTSLKYTFYEY